MFVEGVEFAQDSKAVPTDVPRTGTLWIAPEVLPVPESKY